MMSCTDFIMYMSQLLCVVMFVEEVQADGERAVQGRLAASVSGQHERRLAGGDSVRRADTDAQQSVGEYQRRREPASLSERHQADVQFDDQRPRGAAGLTTVAADDADGRPVQVGARRYTRPSRRPRLRQRPADLRVCCRRRRLDGQPRNPR